jgi:monomeric sarcosine oxidase
MKLPRRQFVKTLATGAALGSTLTGRALGGGAPGVSAGQGSDVVVVGAGAFGAWTAYYLHQAGHKVTLLDAYGPSSDRSSSGGESRIIRMGYAADEIYTRMAMRALVLWKEFSAKHDDPLFYPTGVLLLAHENEPGAQATLATFEKLGVKYKKLNRKDLEDRFPQFSLGSATWGIYEPESGALMARRAIQSLVREMLARGVEYAQGAVSNPERGGRLASVRTRGGDAYAADVFVFACGPWLPKVFPNLLSQRIFPTRQEAFFFGAPAGDQRFLPPAMPTWIDFAEEIYGFPDLENRGIKISLDRHGVAFDPDLGERVVARDSIAAMRQLVARRFPALKDAPLLETRVCQYENTSNGDFLVDRHPDFSNVWLLGGGSGHGYKHSPALGEYTAARILDGGPVEPRFSLATKATAQKRSVY